MLKNISQLQTYINNKFYQFLCDTDSPLPDVKEALFQFLKFAGQVEDAAKEATEKAKKEATETAKSEQESKNDQVQDGNKQ